MKLKKNLKIKDKYFIYCYAFVLLGGIIYLIIQGLKMEQSWKVQLDVLYRACMFLINTIVPFVIYQHFMIDVFNNNQRVTDKRFYNWKSRKIIFRDRKKNFILYVIFSICIVFFLLKFFGSTQLGEIIILLVMGLLTICVNCVMLYFLSKKFVLSSNKKLKNFKVYDKDYANSQAFNNAITPKGNLNSIQFNENDVFDIDTISFLFKQCNGTIFMVDSISIVYNTFNLKKKDGFKIKQNGRFLSLIWLIQCTLINNHEWDKAILKLFSIDYETYSRSRKKYIDDNTLQSSKLDLEAKIDHIIDTKP